MPEEKEKTKPKTTKKKVEVPWPNSLWRLKPGRRLQMKDETAIVSTVDRRGRPLTVCVRREGKVKSVAFKLGDYVRLK